MQFREINAEQAATVLQILKEECGYTADPYNGLGFIRAIITDDPEREHVCHEYRFIGNIGSGTKFRNNGNNDNVPYVDCYPENETPDRVARMAAANKRLAELFPKQ